MNKIKIGNKTIGGESPVFIIAELSANHNQDYKIAAKSLRAMKKAGADAVKLQTYTADTITMDSDKKYFKIKQGTIWDGQTLYKLYQKAFTPWEWQPKLKKIADELGLILFSSPFDDSAVDFLSKMNVPAYKVASFEITDIPLIEYMAKKGKPMIISTGVAELEDIRAAIVACHGVGNYQIVLLKCTSAYPAPYNEMNLQTIADMTKRFKAVIGVSDHSMGKEAAIASVALGAKVVEKHFILDRKIGGPDSSFSMEPQEFRKMVDSIRNTEQAMGKTTYKLSDKSKKNRQFSRSLFVVENINKGEIFTKKNVRSIRPGFGMHPRLYNKVLGRQSKTNIAKGTPLTAGHILNFSGVK